LIITNFKKILLTTKGLINSLFITRFSKKYSFPYSLQRSLYLGFACLLLLSLEEECVDYAEIGHASYYANKFQGRKTSSGEIFSNNKFTAAHSSLPFGTIVRVTNLDNDSIVYVKINDRLPKKATRLLDLTKKAAKDLNFIRKGTTQVILEKVN
jgi:rare lipoprotein A